MKALATLAILFTISSGPASAATTVLDDRDGVGSLRAFVIAYLDRHRDTAFERDRTPHNKGHDREDLLGATRSVGLRHLHQKRRLVRQ